LEASAAGIHGLQSALMGEGPLPPQVVGLRRRLRATPWVCPATLAVHGRYREIAGTRGGAR